MAQMHSSMLSEVLVSERKLGAFIANSGKPRISLIMGVFAILKSIFLISFNPGLSVLSLTF